MSSAKTFLQWPARSTSGAAKIQNRTGFDDKRLKTLKQAAPRHVVYEIRRVEVSGSAIESTLHIADVKSHFVVHVGYKATTLRAWIFGIAPRFGAGRNGLRRAKSVHAIFGGSKKVP